MPPVLAAALGSILRHFLTILATYLVTRGIWTQEEATTYVIAAVAGLIALGWSLYQKYGFAKLLNTAAGMGPTTVAEVKEVIAAGGGASANVQEHVTPSVAPTTKERF
jgi:hypothetical protein